MQNQTRCGTIDKIILWRLIIMSLDTLVNGKYTIFNGVPVLRENNVFCCGDNREKYVMVLMVLSTKKVNYNVVEIEIPENIFGQILATDTTVDPAKRMVKQFTSKGLMDAFDFGLTQLARYNKK